MSQVAPEIVAIDQATANWEELLACADICAATWPKENVTAQSMAESVLERQRKGEFRPGGNIVFAIRDESRGHLAAHAHCFPRPITVDGRAMTILALGAVCTRPEYRKQGLGGAVVKACFSRVDSGEFPYCLFQTSHRNRPFYEELRCSMIANRIINSQAADPQKNPFWDQIVMAYPAEPAFPPGTIDLLGPGY